LVTFTYDIAEGFWTPWAGGKASLATREISHESGKASTLMEVMVAIIFAPSGPDGAADAVTAAA